MFIQTLFKGNVEKFLKDQNNYQQESLAEIIDYNLLIHFFIFIKIKKMLYCFMLIVSYLQY